MSQGSTATHDVAIVAAERDALQVENQKLRVWVAEASALLSEVRTDESAKSTDTALAAGELQEVLAICHQLDIQLTRQAARIRALETAAARNMAPVVVRHDARDALAGMIDSLGADCGEGDGTALRMAGTTK